MLGAFLRRIMPDLDSESLYRALLAKDTRFDGRFFVGVATTGVYCRPVCRARKPLAVNCSFYATAAEAEQAGFRPCLLCRPELAPGYAPVDSSASLARAAARYIERNCGVQGSLTDIARHLGCSNRHLRRVFEDAYHVRPVEYRQTCRLLLAKSLLTDTDLSVVDVAYSAGFGSLRRFNEVFRRRYRLTPTALRSQARLSRTEGDAVQLSLGYRPPYRWDLMLKFLARRAIPGVEKVEEDRYARTIRLRSSGRDLTGWVTVGNDAEHNRLAVTVSASLLPALPVVLDGIKNLRSPLRAGYRGSLTRKHGRVRARTIHPGHTRTGLLRRLRNRRPRGTGPAGHGPGRQDTGRSARPGPRLTRGHWNRRTDHDLPHGSGAPQP